MEILGIGPLEVFLVLILALIVLGPQGMVQVARKFGRWIRALVKSPLWKDITTAQREVSDLPRKLVRDAGLEEVKASLRGPSGEAVRTGAAALLGFMGLLSLQLGLLNLLPIPLLDGGQLFILTIEGMVRRDFSVRFKERLLQAGFVFLVLLMVSVLAFDIAKNLGF